MKVPIKVRLGSGLPVGACQWFEFYSAAAAAASAQFKIFTKGSLNWNRPCLFFDFGNILKVGQKKYLMKFLYDMKIEQSSVEDYQYC